MLIGRHAQDAVAAIGRRDYELARSYRAIFLFELIVGLFALVIYYFISRTFEAAETVGLAGAPDYFAFALVGAILTLMMQTVTTGMARRLREEQLTGTLEALIAQPLSAANVSVGLTAYPFAFSMVSAAIYFLLAYLFLGADFSEANWLGLAVALPAAAMAIASVGLIVGALVLVFKRAEAIAALVVVGLAVLGGAYFPLSVLPGWLRPLAELVPTRFAFEAVRNALYKGEEWVGQAAERAIERAGAGSPNESQGGVERLEARDTVARALEGLSVEEREAIALRYGADLTVPEAAEVLGESLTTVEGRVYRGLRKLREQLSR